MRKAKTNIQDRSLEVLPLVEASYKDHQPGGRCYDYYIKIRGTAVAQEMAAKTKRLWLRALERAKVDPDGRPILELK
jgi:hypothetical protein